MDLMTSPSGGVGLRHKCAMKTAPRGKGDGDTNGRMSRTNDVDLWAKRFGDGLILVAFEPLDDHLGVSKAVTMCCYDACHLPKQPGVPHLLYVHVVSAGIHRSSINIATSCNYRGCGPFASAPRAVHAAFALTGFCTLPLSNLSSDSPVTIAIVSRHVLAFYRMLLFCMYSFARCMVASAAARQRAVIFSARP